MFKGVYRGARGQCPQIYKRGPSPPPYNSELSYFSNLKLKSEQHKKLKRLHTWTRANISEVWRKNYLEWTFILIGLALSGIAKYKLLLNAKPWRLEFGVRKRPFLVFNVDLIYFIHCTAALLSFFLLQTRWSAWRCPWNFKNRNKTKNV